MTPVRSFIAVLALCVLGPAHADGGDQPMKITVVGGSAQGTLMVIGQSIGEMIRRQFPGTSYTYEPGSMGGSLMRVMQGQVPIAITGAIELQAAAQRQPPFHQAPDVEITVVARVSDFLYGYFIARRDFVQRHGLRNLADIRRLRVPVRISIGEPGNLTVTTQARAYLAAVGMTPTDIERWGGTVFRLPKAQSFNLMQENRADITFTGSYQPDAFILELARTTPVQFLDPGKEMVQQVAESVGIEAASISAGAYDFVTSDVPATTSQVFLVVRADESEELTYRLATALYRQFDYLRTVHPAFRQLRASMLGDAGRQHLHPGAARFYREVGLLSQ